MKQPMYPASPSLRGDDAMTVRGDRYRFTLIGERVLRLEYDPEGLFEDRATQMIRNRRIGPAAFSVWEDGDTLEIDTAEYTLYYRKGPFTPDSLTIDAHNAYTNYGARWRFGQAQYGDPPRHHNLCGTARTLDKVDGECALDFGLADKSGHALLDDSQGMVLAEDGSLEPRREGVVDMYYFATRHDYTGTLRDFYLLTGAPPLLPRWALGNWWSRYYAYSAESYQALLYRFRAEELPFTVAVMDMDWHVTRVPERCGRGWTGYTWNRELFPDPEGFLASVHRQGYHTALNLHPADGVQPCEEQYPAVARALGVDPDTRRPIAFDCASPRFLEVYMEELLHPLVRQGVDFFWIDWQQGRFGGQRGLDPLWVLNDLHYRDSERQRGRGMILSRYAGPGSHRYPVGFSGDTVASWASLRFQPYFTATAANIGYSWWSHDIGGFRAGVRDGEMYLRWLQLGVFLPILRLHCTKNPFCAREPWSFGRETAELAGEALRLRHRLIPYWYSMNYLGWRDLHASLYPLYHAWPDCPEAYQFPNEYCFGSELVVCPITEKCDSRTTLGSVQAWIPAGVWTDLFTGRVYRGSRRAVLCRGRESIPVLAKPGAVVPMDGRERPGNSTANPDVMDVHLFPGAENTFELFEDAGDGDGYRRGEMAITTFRWEGTGDTLRLTVAVKGDASLLPESRLYRFHLRGFRPGTVGGAQAPAMTLCAGERSVLLERRAARGEGFTLTLGDVQPLPRASLREQAFVLLHQAQMEIELKTAIYGLFAEEAEAPAILSGLMGMELDRPLLDALTELVLCEGMP
ncbi:MAG: glycoside hydrolase family 31 protein [Eubacteriales bacterium]|nr:glycoside hydrolase family 31 protein [Eubacteriales bacterium]